MCGLNTYCRDVTGRSDYVVRCDALSWMPVNRVCLLVTVLVYHGFRMDQVILYTRLSFLWECLENGSFRDSHYAQDFALSESVFPQKGIFRRDLESCHLWDLEDSNVQSLLLFLWDSSTVVVCYLVLTRLGDAVSNNFSYPLCFLHMEQRCASFFWSLLFINQTH